MSLHETIIDQEDREFITTIDHWTGDAIWEPAGDGFAGGVASLYLQEHEDTKSMSLAYPHIQPKKGHTHRLYGGAGSAPFGKTITLIWTLTDGIQTFTDQILVIASATPTPIDFNIDVPQDFKEDQAKLTITAYEDAPDNNDALFIDRLSLTWESKIDYFPILVIG